MEAEQDRVVSLPAESGSAEERMLRVDLVREIMARKERGEGVKLIARELGIDRKTVKRWLRCGAWQPRRARQLPRPIDRFAEFIEHRVAEVGWNGVVLHRELVGLGFTGTYQQVQRYLKPLRAKRRWSQLATVRFETDPGEQAQVDYGQLRVWIGEQPETVHLFVFTLGYSRRLFARGYRNERLATLLDGHERALRHFGGVTLTCLYDNPRTLVLGRSENKVLWHPVFEDFARYYGFTPRACQPRRAQTKGKVESGVKYVKRNALAGRRFSSWEELNRWLERWTAEVADVRVHGTTHERPIDRFAREQLTPLGARAPYHYERVRMRRVANDALVAVGAARYSVPVEYVGLTVSVHEGTGHYEFFHQEQLIARHPKSARFSVVMAPEHYAGLLRLGRQATLAAPPRFDPNFNRLGEVMVHDLALYEAASRSEGGEAQ
jgi:transposase/ribosomal protein S19